MSVAKNDITGDFIQSKQSNKNYEDNYDIIFGNNFGFIEDSDGNKIPKCSRRCWIELENNEITCRKPNCDR